MIDLFAGAGGLSYGFLMTGKYKIVAAAEINKNAQQTYMANIPQDNDFVMVDNVVGYDFTQLNKHFNGIDVVVGGPPCQGFSNANRHKNHLISMNNSLIKEFFRAIKEIRPKAFIMENVNMLQSEKHRFYESQKDADVINELRETGYIIPQRKDEIYISPITYDEIDIGDLQRTFNFLLPESLFRMINVLFKNASKPDRLEKYLKKNGESIVKNVNRYVEENKLNDTNFGNKLLSVAGSIEKDAVDYCLEDLEYIVELQKTIRIMKEIQDNQLIGEYRNEGRNELKFIVNSYSVIDYVNAILGGQYRQIGRTLCSENFGVPQERRRYIVMGIRNDVCRRNTISLPEGKENSNITTVNDAIHDLERYEPSFETNYTELMYKENDVISEYADRMRRGSKTIKNHIVTKTGEKALSRYKLIKQGHNFHSLPIEQKDTYEKPERTQNTIYLRLDPNKPCGTVVNVRKSMWIHPNLDRAISVREAARLQSFPDVFEFVGTKDSQYQQVGNAVPPLMAKTIADNLAEYLKNI